MANTPKKMKDPTEAALSAIQDALQVKEDKPSGAEGNQATTPDEPADDKPWPGLRSKQQAKGPYDDEGRRPVGR